MYIMKQIKSLIMGLLVFLISIPASAMDYWATISVINKSPVL